MAPKNYTLKYASVVCFAALAMFLGGCAKDGETGPPGKDGNANVTTILDTIQPSDWTLIATNQYTFSKTIPAIVDMNKDLVLVYTRRASGWAPLPLTDVLSLGDELTYWYSTGIRYNYSNLFAPLSPLYVKIVVITNP